MKFGTLALIALALGAFAAQVLIVDRGYVLIQTHGHALEMSVPGLILALLVLYLAVRGIVWIFRAPRRVGKAAGRYKVRRAERDATRGLIQLAEGHYAKGEKLLGRGIRDSAGPLANYLGAARAADSQGQGERRDEWLRLAENRHPDASAAVLLTQAELEVCSGEDERALATLRRLEAEHPGNPVGLCRLAEISESLGDWDGLRRLVPKLRRHHAMKDAALNDLAVRTECAYLAQVAAEGDADALRSAWTSVGRDLQRDPRVIGAYVNSGMPLLDHERLEKMLRKDIERRWDSGLVRLYGELSPPDAAAHLARAERWLLSHGDDPDLLLTAARLCMKNQLWGKARSYLETSLSVRPDAEAYQVYGRLLEEIGEPMGASEAFRQGLDLATAADVPRLTGPAG
jgi:HemY protein